MSFNLNGMIVYFSQLYSLNSTIIFFKKGIELIAKKYVTLKQNRLAFSR